MRKATIKATDAFVNGGTLSAGNTRVFLDGFGGSVLELFGNEIAYIDGPDRRKMTITNRGFFTPTTKERLNGLPNVNIVQRKGDWYLNGEKWDGSLTEIAI